MLIFTPASWGLPRFIAGMIGMTAWLDRGRVLDGPDKKAEFNPYAAALTLAGGALVSGDTTNEPDFLV